MTVDGAPTRLAWTPARGSGVPSRLDAELLLRHVAGWDRAALLTRATALAPSDAARALLRPRRGARPAAAPSAPHRDPGLLAARLPGHPRRAHPPARDRAAGRSRRSRLLRDSPAPTIVDVGHRQRLHRALPRRGAARRGASHAIDVSEPALAVARENARRLGLVGGSTFHLGDLLEPRSVPRGLDRPRGRPTRPTSTRARRPRWRPRCATTSPALALFAPGDRYSVYRRLAPAAAGAASARRLPAPGSGHRDGRRGAAPLRGGRPRWTARVLADLQGHPAHDRGSAHGGPDDRLDSARMDKIRVVGGRPLEGTVRISGAKNASLPDLCAALLTDETRRLAQRARGAGHPHHGARAERARGRGRVPGRGHGGGQGARRSPPSRPLRSRQDDARLGAGAGPAARPRGPGARLASRRLRDRRPAHQPPPHGPREDGRQHRGRARLRRGPGRAPARAPRSTSTPSPSPAPRTS